MDNLELYVDFLDLTVEQKNTILEKIAAFKANPSSFCKCEFAPGSCSLAHLEDQQSH